jgi:hypothetical protein
MACVVNTVMEKNCSINSAGVGTPNLIKQDRTALKEFQAQDIWLGAQFSLASAALPAGCRGESWSLVEAQYCNPYVKAKIPLGAPEGFHARNPEGLEYTAGRDLRPGTTWSRAYLFPMVR